MLPFFVVMNSKEVLVIPQYDAVDINDKFTPKKKYDYLLTNAFFVSRDIAKGNNTLRQIVPYVIYENKGKYLVSSYIKDNKKRLCLGTYNYLYNDYEFTTLENYILKYFDVEKIKFIGFVKDNINYADHIGCVFLSHDKTFKHKKINGERYEWKSVRELINEYGSYEIWSRNIIDDYILRKGSFLREK